MDLDLIDRIMLCHISYHEVDRGTFLFTEQTLTYWSASGIPIYKFLHFEARAIHIDNTTYLHRFH